MNFTKEELNSILALINLAPIKGSDALVVAILQNKIAKMLEPVAATTPEEPKVETKKTK